MAEVVNLKSPIVFRVDLNGNIAAFSTKAFRSQLVRDKIPESKDHVAFEVTEIAIDASDPWYRFPKPVTVTVLWANVLSVQYDDCFPEKKEA